MFSGMSLAQHAQRLQNRLKTVGLAGVLALPPRVKRVLAGRPVRREGQTLDTDTQLLLLGIRLLREKGPERFPVPVGRQVLDTQTALVGGRHPIGAVVQRRLGGRPVRIYVPQALAGSSEDRPTLVFFHGGGFIYGGLASHDAPCRFVAEQAGVQVIAVDYRLAPEHPFPAAYDDCVAAFEHVVAHAGELSVDTTRLAVGGDSAGGNLAAGVALHAAHQRLPLAFQLLVYPTTDPAATGGSRETFAHGFYLTDEFMTLATASYQPDVSRRSDPRFAPLKADLPAGLAPAYVVTAGFDPLRDEGEAYAGRLREAGVAVELRRQEGLIHGFLNCVGVGTSGPAAVAEIADRLAAGVKA